MCFSNVCIYYTKVTPLDRNPNFFQDSDTDSEIPTSKSISIINIIKYFFYLIPPCSKRRMKNNLNDV